MFIKLLLILRLTKPIKMVTMKSKTFFMPFIVAMALFAVSFVLAADVAQSGSVITELNSVVLSSSSDTVVFVEDTVPVRVTFDADVDTQDVRVEVSINGLREDISDVTARFDVEAGKTYTKLLKLEMPSKLDDLTEEVTLNVEIYNSKNESVENYAVTIQRDSYDLTVLSVDYNTQVSAGEVFPVSVVMKNTGYHRTDDAYVVAAIPELGVSSRGYAGDLIPVEDYIEYDDEEDSVNKVVYLQVPANAPAGVYEMVITVYNDDAETEVTKLVSVSEAGTSTVLAATKSQDVSAGETAEFDLIVVNSASTTKVYTLSAISSKDLIVSVPSVVAVGAGDSKTVTVKATVPEGTEAGTYTFTADVDGKQVVFAANVVNGASSSSTSSVSPSIVGLTVVLVIVFVVLLVVLIILISRKDNTVEEVETSYY